MHTTMEANNKSSYYDHFIAISQHAESHQCTSKCTKERVDNHTTFSTIKY